MSINCTLAIWALTLKSGTLKRWKKHFFGSRARHVVHLCSAKAAEATAALGYNACHCCRSGAEGCLKLVLLILLQLVLLVLLLPFTVDYY